MRRSRLHPSLSKTGGICSLFPRFRAMGRIAGDILGFLTLPTVSPAELSRGHPAVVGLVPLSWNHRSAG